MNQGIIILEAGTEILLEFSFIAGRQRDNHQGTGLGRFGQQEKFGTGSRLADIKYAGIQETASGAVNI